MVKYSKKKVSPPMSTLSKQDNVLMTPLAKHQKKAAIDNEITSAHGLYEKNLTKRALYKTNDVDMSEDLVQSTFLKALLYLQKGGKVDIMHAFLNHILNDLIVDEYRKRKVFSLDSLLEQGFDPSIDYTEQLINILDGRKMIFLIDQLPEKYKLVIKMRYVRGLSIREIATLTRQTPNYVSVQSYRGLRKLAALKTSGHTKN